MSRSQTLRFALVVLIWGLTWRVIADQVHGPVPPIWSVSYRFLIAGAAMAAVVVLRRDPLHLDARGHLFAAGVALFQFVLNFNLVYAAEERVTSGLPAVVFALLVVPNSLLAWAFLRQPLSARVGVGALLGIAGVGLLFHDELTRPGALGGAAALGLGLTALGMLCASVANVMQATRVGHAQPPLTMLAYAMLYGGLADAALGWGLHGAPVLPSAMRYWAGIAYLAVFGSAVAFAVYFKLIREIGPARAAYTSLAIPFVAMTVSTLSEGYRWTAYAVAGAALALAGIVTAMGVRRA